MGRFLLWIFFAPHVEQAMAWWVDLRSGMGLGLLAFVGAALIPFHMMRLLCIEWTGLDWNWDRIKWEWEKVAFSTLLYCFSLSVLRVVYLLLE